MLKCFSANLFRLEAAGDAMFVDGTAAVALARVTDVTSRVICTTTGWCQHVTRTYETFETHELFQLQWDECILSLLCCVIYNWTIQVWWHI